MEAYLSGAHVSHVTGRPTWPRHHVPVERPPALDRKVRLPPTYYLVFQVDEMKLQFFDVCLAETLPGILEGSRVSSRASLKSCGHARAGKKVVRPAARRLSETYVSIYFSPTVQYSTVGG